MSRRPPNPAAQRAAQNQQTIKNLLKLEPNKVCADCKRNKHPRWASWNLGVFICIRCSGIHRGMGTHISRVKSVDLDSWTDEQLQSILSWGNARANKYWESKLAPGHVPSEAKIENFIRTKYELKRWVMDGPKPDPATLDVDGDDDVPLSIVKEKQNVERRESVRKASVGQSAAPSSKVPASQADLIGGDDLPQRSNSAGPSSVKVASKAGPAPPKTTSTKDSLLGLDFFGEPAAPPRPASTSNAGGVGTAPSRPDLKQSILSLYATAPRPQAQPSQSTQAPGSFGSMPSPNNGHQQQSSLGGVQDAFSSLSFTSTTSPKPAPAAADPFASFSSPPLSTRPAPQASSTASSAFGGLSGGSFFDSKPAAPSGPSHQKQVSNSSFGGFAWSTSPPPASAAVAPPPAKQTQPSSMGDLFDLSAPTSQPVSAPKATSSTASSGSVFNLSSDTPKPSQPAVTSTTSTPLASSNLSGADVWGSNAWGAPDASSSTNAPQASKSSATTASSSGVGGWGGSAALGSGSFADTPIVPGASGGFSAAPKVSADEEFGGWTSSTGPTTSSGNSAAKPATGSFAGNDDLFSNVWQ
ncbi:ArfGap-domain-containing protein [Sodiomyces alkalinus F11]|uniref:ArfGap-domain-containing protein n=1 Tax=Sodiomyces alkalinus (strain CBS 110278 / VKM F-3762 / F11) TaxID=1314773 RepID=A0A3N2PP12_SODAK|nr:ArfGap-domain-containing protein [Sodiomyces alkalinus F11]ROT36258.1 ArfGap-domain-containing protein [Sodiomyces alkalinus F11]